MVALLVVYLLSGHPVDMDLLGDGDKIESCRTEAQVAFANLPRKGKEIKLYCVDLATNKQEEQKDAKASEHSNKGISEL